MISLPHLLTTARRFVDGVCAIPRLASMERLEEMREAYRKAVEIRRELEIDEGSRRNSIERELESVYNRFRQALIGLGVDGAAVARFIDGEEVEGDFITARDAQVIDECNKRQDAERELSAEREAHASDNDRHTRARMQLGDKIEELNEQLSAARADLEALTVWRSQGVDYLPADVRALCATRNGDEYRHTPESLAALKREGGSDAK